LRIDCLELGSFATNCYVLRSAVGSGKCLIVDPGFSAEPLVGFLEAERLVPERILLTHGHGDHIGGIPLLRRRFGKVGVWISQADAAMLVDSELNLTSMFGMPVELDDDEVEGGLLGAGDVVTFDDIRLEVLATPGHTPGGLSFYCRSDGVVLVGDSLFAGSIGRDDFPGGDQRLLLRSIREQLFSLPDETKVYPGHGPATTVGHEKQSNPFFYGLS